MVRSRLFLVIDLIKQRFSVEHSKHGFEHLRGMLSFAYEVAEALR
jgi:hypothetical protein